MIDIERTRKYYRGISENDLCHCIYCDHYIRNIRHAYPEIDRYLRATGADTEKPFEVMSVPLDDNGEILYIAAQYILMGTPEGFEGFKCNGTEVRIAESHPSTDIKEDHFVIEITPVVMEWKKRSVRINRRRAFRSALVPYWIIVSKATKKQFMEEHEWVENFCDRDKRGFTLPRTDAEELDALGARILNGQTRDILIAEDEVSLFVCTSYGTISNEIRLDELKSKSLNRVLPVY